MQARVKAGNQRREQHAPSITDAQREALDVALDSPLWCDASDSEMASYVGCAPASVRAAREQRRQDLITAEIRLEARELARLRGHQGRLGDLVLEVMRDAVADAIYEQRVTERLQAVAERARKATGARRSADGTTMRSSAPAQVQRGVSGRKGPETTATARRRESTGRDGRGSGAARETG